MRLALITCSLLLLPLAAQDTKDWINQGVASYKSGHYAEAVQAFERAVASDPASVPAHLYLGSAYMSQFIPGANSPGNDGMAQNAEKEFKRVLELQAGNPTALRSLAALAHQQAQGTVDPVEKQQLLGVAREHYKEVLAREPMDRDANSNLGVIAWSQSFPATSAARAQLGMRPDEPGPIPNNSVRLELKSRYFASVEEGLSNLLRALQVDPSYDDAMSYMNLLLRVRADLADTPEEYRRDIASADGWVQKAMEAKSAKTPLRGPGAPQRIRVGGNVQAAQLVTKVDPVYPPLAVQARIQGTVRFTVVIDRDGHVVNVQLVSGHPLLVRAASDAVKQWVYKVSLLNGNPVEVVTQVDVNFTLNP